MYNLNTDDLLGNSLAIVAMGACYERSGVVNIALEGTMMFGAFVEYYA